MLEEPDEMAKERYCFAAGAQAQGRGLLRGAEAVSQRGHPAAGRSDPAVPVGHLRPDDLPAPQGVLHPDRRAHRRAAGDVARPSSTSTIASWFRRSSAASSSAPSPCCSGPSWTTATSRPPTCCSGAWRALQLRYSLVIVPWALLLLFYFLRRLGKQGEMIGQIAGVVTAAVAVLRYEDLNDWAVRLLGVGTNMWIVGVLVALAVVGLRRRSCGRSAACQGPARLGLRVELTRAGNAARAGHPVESMPNGAPPLPLANSSSDSGNRAGARHCRSCRMLTVYDAAEGALIKRDGVGGHEGRRLDRSPQPDQGRGPAGRADAVDLGADARGDVARSRPRAASTSRAAPTT